MDMIDIAIAKAFATKVAAGFSKVEVDGMTINFTLNDGTITSLTVPTPADGVSVTDINIDENGNLICTMSDETEINAGKVLPEKGVDYYTPEEIEEIKIEIENALQENVDEVQAQITRLRSNFDRNTPTPSDNLTIEDAINDEIDSYSSIGKTNQKTTSISNGDEYDSPSPEHPQPIENVWGKVTVEASNKNLFNISKVTNLAFATIQDKGIVILQREAYRGYYLKVFPGETYTISRKNNTFPNRFRYCFTINEPANEVKGFDSYADDFTQKAVTVPENMNYLFLYLSQANETITEDMEIQIEKESNKSSYISHQGQSITFPLADGQKLMQGDYLADDGIHHVRAQMILPDATKLLTGTVLGTNCKLTDYSLTGAKSVGRSYNFKCDKIKPANEQYGQYSGYRNSTNFIVMTNLEDTLDNFNSKITGSILEYELAKEVIEPYTSEQQIAWNNLQRLETYKGQTYIYTNSDGLSPDSKVTYLIDPRLATEKISNKTVSISTTSTDLEYPSAKAVYNYVETKLASFNSSNNTLTIKTASLE